MDDASRFTVEDAERICAEHYGQQVRVEPLPSYIDQNFLVRVDDGTRFVLKIANPDEPREVLELQQRAMMWIAERRAGVAPRVVPTTAGETLFPLRDGEGRERFVWMVDFVEGTLYVEIEGQDPALRTDLGRFVGELDHALAGFEHAGAHGRELVWDLARAAWIVPHIRQIQHPERRRIVQALMDRFVDRVEPALAGLRHGVVHNDANDYNVMVDPETRRVCGIVDFGDMVHGPLVVEIAITIAYAILDQHDPLQAAVDVVAGYHPVFPLEEDEVDLLFDLVCARLCVSVTNHALASQRDPGNAYLDVSQQGAWVALEGLINVDPEHARARLRQACGFAVDGALAGVDAREQSALKRRRDAHLGPTLSLSYSRPLTIVRGSGPYLFDDRGRNYLDCVNNVCHVGHCHPHVVQAAQEQIATLNTNTRYLHEAIVRYAERLTATLPEPLSVCYLVCSGSEANELALRLARAHTGNHDVMVVDGAYHGNTGTLVDISPYKFAGPGGAGAKDWVHVTSMPDGYRGKHRGDLSRIGPAYVGEAEETLAGAKGAGRRLAAFICESLLSCGGQIDLPDGYLSGVYAAVRGSGGVCIADEVQVGFGRVGTHMWGFEQQGVVPDIVTMGKPIGNGHPLAAVVTTPEIAASFDNGMEYFNTFGGNPVSSRVGMAVLDVIESEGIPRRASEIGGQIARGLRELAARHGLIGDVRGRGLFLGAELVRDRNSLEPADAEASAVVEEARSRGVLLSTDGPLHNVLKIKPPIVWSPQHAERLLKVLGESLAAVEEM